MNWLEDNGIFIPMLNDKGRNKFYKSAIESCVKDKVVVDIGTGTGLLSILAAKAGAKKVFSVERDPGRTDFAKKIFASLGYSDIIEVIHADYLDIDLSADIFISETIGNWIFEEKILEIGKHSAKHGGKFIPSRFELTLVVYKDHQMFNVGLGENDSVDFKPGVDIDDRFINLVNSEFHNKHSRQYQVERSNVIFNLFQAHKKTNELKLEILYKSKPLIIDTLNPPDNIEITMPSGILEYIPQGVRACIFWTAGFENFIMDVTDTIWGVPSKFIRNSKGVIKCYFDKTTYNQWMWQTGDSNNE
jgi:predicted RNA methylase